jgi:glucose-1-phosphate thymidylyltransferase
MKGLILSGGKGTRLRPLTFTLAKQLVPLANKPVLVRVIETLRNAGITEVGIVVGDTAPDIKAELARRELGVSLTFIPQDSPDGLAHAVKISRDFLGDDRFVMYLGDNALEGGVTNLIRAFDHGDWNSQIVLKRVKNPSAYGVAALKPDGSIERLVEKPAHPPSDLALVGVYMFDHHVFEAVSAIQPSWRGEYEITDAIQWLIEQNYRVVPYEHSGWWFDTGKAPDLLEANSQVLAELTPTIAPDAVIDAASQVDTRVTVERGAKIINSVVRGPSIIGEDSVIENSYVGPYTSIYHHVTVRNCEIERSIILEHSQILDIGARMQDSLIGRYAEVTRDNHGKPKALKMNLGDYSTVFTT